MRYLIFLILLSPLWLAAQTNQPYFAARAQTSDAPGDLGGGLYRLTLTITDETAVYDGLDILDDSTFVYICPSTIPGEDINLFPVVNIVLAFAGQVTVDVRDIASAGPPQTGRNVICESSEQGLFAYVSGAGDPINQAISDYNMKRINIEFPAGGGTTNRVWAIASSPDTTSISTPIEADVAYISSDSIWFRGATSWLFFSGGSGGGGSTEQADGLTILGDGTGGSPFRVNTDSLHGNVLTLNYASPLLLPPCSTSASFVFSGLVVDDSIRVGSDISSLLDETANAQLAITYIQEEDGYAHFEMSGTLTAATWFPLIEYKGITLSPTITISSQPCYTDTLTNYPSRTELADTSAAIRADFPPGDNLGDHTATTNLNMAGNTILGGTGTGSDLILQSTSGVGDATSEILFQVGNNGGTEAMRIRGNGNVGINQSTPAQTLHVQGTARITGSDGVGTRVMLRDADGDISDATLGDGITLTTGTLVANDTVTTLIQDSILVYSLAGTEVARDTVRTPGGGGGSGTVTSVGLSLPSQFTVSGSPVTTSGTLSGTWNAQSANTVLAGPASGGAAAPTFRSLVAADITAGGGALGTGAANHIAYWTGTNNIAHDASQLYWDETNNRLGIGTASPSYSIHTEGSSTDAIRNLIRNTSSGAAAFTVFQFGNNVTPVAGGFFLNSSANTQYGGNNSLNVINVQNAPATLGTNNLVRLHIAGGGNVGLGTTSPSYILDINGTGGARIPVGTTAQRPTGADGVIRYNSTLARPEWYGSSTWNAFTWLKPSLEAGNVSITGSNALSMTDASITAGDIDINPSGAAQVFLYRYSSDINANEFITAKARGTRSAPAVVHPSDYLGGMEFFGYTPTGFARFGSILPIVADTTDSNKSIELLIATNFNNLTNPYTAWFKDNNTDFNGSGGLKLYVGTTGQRPTNALGKIRGNSTTTNVEIADGTNWFGLIQDGGNASGTTDGSGDITVSHTLGTASFSAVCTATGTTFYNVQVHTKTSTTFKIRFFDAAGSAVTSTAVTADWIAKKIMI